MNKIPRICALVAQITYKDWTFYLDARAGGLLLQIRFLAPDVHTGEPAMQYCRKWYISSHSTDNEVIRTCFLAVQTAEAHELAEQFHYRGVRVANPHLDIASIGNFLADNPQHAWNLDDHRPEPARVTVEQVADSARKAPGGRAFFAGGEPLLSLEQVAAAVRQHPELNAPYAPLDNWRDILVEPVLPGRDRP